MVRTYSFSYRRRNPEMFPYVCDECRPERRFMEDSHKAQHDNMKHGVNEFEVQNMFYMYDHKIPTVSNNWAYKSSCSLGNMSASQLQTFVNKEIEPDTTYNSSCRAVVNRLYHFMQNNFPAKLRPSQVLKSGSLGKGTAVKGKSDADLVVFLSKFRSIPDLRDSLPNILETMKLYLGSYGECIVEGVTSHAVKVSLSCHANHTHNVDILPSVNILNRKANKDIYKAMSKESAYEREFYSAALAPLQKKFVAGVPKKVKTLIQLVKYWRKTFFEESKGQQRLPSSYPLELITIGEWEDAGSPESFDLLNGFYQVLRAIKNYENIQHAWNINYKADDFISDDDEFYVLDPANPFNNVMKACNCWDTVSDKAAEFLSMPLFYGLSSSAEW
ncbi:2'-5'-oligoadenylate synthase 1A-like [Saccostrea cucullata]|uniref:2'-5'-oligoadenylate synthase 1A-like n=1 Tax=Saccostrea cuccullata TaxID=36930 RepID=UPI002ED54820